MDESRGQEGSEEAIRDMGRQMAKGGEWGELPGYAPGEARPSTAPGTHPFRLTVPPSLFLVMVGFPVTLASCSKKRCWKDHSSACNPASHSIAQHHPSIIQYCPNQEHRQISPS